MTERSATLLLALGALILFYLLMFGGRAPAVTDAPARPVSSEIAPNGYAALKLWLQRSGVRVHELRARYPELTAATVDLPARGNLLIVTLPGEQGVRTEELATLDRWLRRGNTLLVLVALLDRPDWAQAAENSGLFDLAAITGLEFDTPPQRARRQRGGAPAVQNAPITRRDLALIVRPEPLRARPTRPHVLLAGVRTIAGLTDYRADALSLRQPYGGFALELLRTSPGSEGAMWLRAVGDGHILVSAFGSLLTNRAIARDDNAVLLANLVAHSVAPDGAVIFDDFRQGVTATVDADRFFSDPRLFWTVAVLLLVWLFWVVGATRLRTPVARSPAPRQIDQVAANGAFFARVIRPWDAAARMLELQRLRLAARAGLPRDAPPPWEWLARHPRIAAADLEALRSAYGGLHPRRRARLIELHNLIQRIDRQLS